MRSCVEVERHICRCEHVKILSWNTLSGTLFWDTLGLHCSPSTHTISQRVAHAQDKSRSRLQFAYETSSKSEAPSLQNERFVRDFLQKWSATNPKRTLTCISRARHARSSQRVAPDRDRSHSRLHFAPSTCTISSEGCPRPEQIALSYYICTTNWPGVSPAPKNSFPYYICTPNWPLLTPPPKSSFPYYMCTTN